MKSASISLALAGCLTMSAAAAAKKDKGNAPTSMFERPTSGLGAVELVHADLKTAEHVFKKTPQGDLKLYFHFPAGWNASDRRPAILFFFGGGWSHGSALQFLPQAEYFATRGLVTVRADYRISSIHKTTPDKCVEDAKSAMRWLRGHAKEFGIDPEKLISSGGSAGGHLAAAVATLPGFDAADDDLKISCIPNAMILFNPALNLDQVGRSVTNGVGEKIGAAISPTGFVKKTTPPSIIFFGTADRLKAHGDEFLKKSRELGARCEQFTAEGQAHGFFNRQPWTTATAIQADRFLASLGYVKGEPTLKPADDKAVLKKSD